MSKIVITDSNEFENIIYNLEMSLPRIKEIFQNETNDMENINQTDIWSGKTQEIVFNKYCELKENFSPIEESLQIYIDFLKNTLSDYRTLENKFKNDMNLNDQNLNVNS